MLERRKFVLQTSLLTRLLLLRRRPLSHRLLPCRLAIKAYTLELLLYRHTSDGKRLFTLLSFHTLEVTPPLPPRDGMGFLENGESVSCPALVAPPLSPTFVC